MSPLDSNCGSTSTSPGSASSSSVFSPHTTYPTNGSTAIGSFSSAAPVPYPPTLNYTQTYMPTMYDSRPRNPSMYVSFSHACPSTPPPPPPSPNLLFLCAKEDERSIVPVRSNSCQRELVRRHRVCRLPPSHQGIPMLRCMVRPREITIPHRHPTSSLLRSLMDIPSYRTPRRNPC